MDIADIVNLERIEIIEETEDCHRIKYKNNTYEIAKSTESCFVTHSSSPGPTLEHRLEQKLIPETEIFQDENVPQEYKEVMMFHELREMEYKAAGFEDAHERAINDEVLYVLKFFDEKTREGYLQFAREYRKTHAGKTIEDTIPEKPEDEIRRQKKIALHSYDLTRAGKNVVLVAKRTFRDDECTPGKVERISEADRRFLYACWCNAANLPKSPVLPDIYEKRHFEEFSYLIKADVFELERFKNSRKVGASVVGEKEMRDEIIEYLNNIASNHPRVIYMDDDAITLERASQIQNVTTINYENHVPTVLRQLLTTADQRD